MTRAAREVYNGCLYASAEKTHHEYYSVFYYKITFYTKINEKRHHYTRFLHIKKTDANAYDKEDWLNFFAGHPLLFVHPTIFKNTKTGTLANIKFTHCE